MSEPIPWLTFGHFSEIYAGWEIRMDEALEILNWFGTSDGETQAVTLKFRRKPKSVSQVYREGIAGHSHANWMVEGGYVDSDI